MPLLVLLAGCGAEREREQAVEPSEAVELALPPSTQPSAIAPSTQVPLPPGYYAIGEDCSAALQDGNLGIEIDTTHWRDVDADYPMLPVADLGGGKFKLGEAAETLRQTGEGRFVADEGTEHERTLTWCAETRPE